MTSPQKYDMPGPRIVCYAYGQIVLCLYFDFQCELCYYYFISSWLWACNYINQLQASKFGFYQTVLFQSVH